MAAGHEQPPVAEKSVAAAEDVAPAVVGLDGRAVGGVPDECELVSLRSPMRPFLARPEEDATIRQEMGVNGHVWRPTTRRRPPSAYLRVGHREAGCGRIRGLLAHCRGPSGVLTRVQREERKASGREEGKRCGKLFRKDH